MESNFKSQAEILRKLGIEQLNPMQEEAKLAIMASKETILLSPTGTGKTVAFLLPLLNELDIDNEEIQAIIIVPSRELAIQIEQVLREMGTGYKVNCVYGGRPASKDRLELAHRPAVLIGTPGRIADHLRREEFFTGAIKTLVLDEYDKSLEIGFEGEMSEIIEMLPNVEKKIMTSATIGVRMPAFLGLENPITIDYLDGNETQLKIKQVISPSKDKLETLVKLMASLGHQHGIIFCNFKDTINRVSEYLTEHNISHGAFYGGLEQKDRERSLIKFRNGTHKILLATDLAARGIDVPELDFIVHYHLPTREEEFTHRNGRTARMNSNGTAFILKYEGDKLPPFMDDYPIQKVLNASLPLPSEWCTLFISGGRKDKISKGDIAGLFFKQGKLDRDALGIIELKVDCAFVSVKVAALDKLLPLVNNQRLKKKKVRVYEI
ncbi:ATP-independent RNA helicase [unidentified eubacterium SCB49]|nr:ATP-independent RNA helicase [unidentified eubacterium SCB49]